MVEDGLEPEVNKETRAELAGQEASRAEQAEQTELALERIRQN